MFIDWRGRMIKDNIPFSILVYDSDCNSMENDSMHKIMSNTTYINNNIFYNININTSIECK